MRTNSHHLHRPRELRRRVVVRARLHMGALWTDACILNVSSRGLMIRASRAAPTGSVIELWRGDLVVTARVVWRQGVKAGLRAEHPVPVEEIMTLGQSPGLQLTAGERPACERRRRPRTHELSRLHGRAFEFASAAVIALSLAMTAYGFVEQALARPLSRVQAALDN